MLLDYGSHHVPQFSGRTQGIELDAFTLEGIRVGIAVALGRAGWEVVFGNVRLSKRNTPDIRGRAIQFFAEFCKLDLIVRGIRTPDGSWSPNW